MRSLRTRIALVVISVVLVTTFSILFFQQQTLFDSTSEIQEENSQNLVNTIVLSVESQYHSILFHKNAMMEKRKSMLRSVLGLAMVQVERSYKKFKDGVISERDAKKEAIEALKAMRYDDGVGYLWINTNERPTPKMIMHATIPELDGQILDAPRFDCALGRNENLFRAMVDVCEEYGKGYVDYLWPKPTHHGLTDRVPKLSYVEPFRPWGWIVGTGLYIDDIEADADKRLAAVLKELQAYFARVKVGESGYTFLFNGDEEMLIHPYMAGEDLSKYPNPSTGNPILVDLKKAANSPSQNLKYIWDKPPDHSGEFKFRKIAYVQHFAPLDWYIASSVYFDESEKIARELRWKVIVIGVILLAMGLVLSLWLSSSLARPLTELSSAAKAIRSNGGLHDKVPVSGTIETRELGTVLNEMLSSLQSEISERRQAEATLKSALSEKEVLLREVHHRVKNNLAVITSLLNMQAKRVDDLVVKASLEESRSRIAAMSLIHETLYQSDNLAEIPLKEYVGNVYKILQQVMMKSPGDVRFTMSGESINLTIDQAVPCGLVLNELITNSLKYGYPKGGKGTISLSAEIIKDHWVQLNYSDDGVGLPVDFSPNQKKKLGMRIVRLLVENQLGGEFSWKTGPGARFTIRWPLYEEDSVEVVDETA